MPQYAPLSSVANQDGRVANGVVDISGASTAQPLRGQTYIRIFIANAQAAEPVARSIMAEGYLYQGFGVALGLRVEPGPEGGHGAMRSIDLGDPAGNAEYADQTVPTNASWKIRGMTVVLVTDGTGANRFFHIQVTDGTTKVLDIIPTHHITASLTANFTGYPGGPPQSIAILLGGMYVGIPLPNVLFPEAYVLDFTTDNIQATDAWGDGQMLVEEWLVV